MHSFEGYVLIIALSLILKGLGSKLFLKRIAHILGYYKNCWQKRC